MAQTRDRHRAIARPYTRHIRQLLALISPWKSISYPDFFRPPALTRSFTDTCTAPEAGVRAGSLTALSAHSNRSRYHSTWSLLRSCCTDPGGSCSQPAPISLLCAGNINPCSAPGAAALPTLLRLGSGIDLCLESPGEFGSQLRMVLARTDREQTDFLPHGIAGRKQ